MGDCHGAEKLDHYLYKCMVGRAAHHVLWDLPKSRWVKVEPEKRIFDPMKGQGEDLQTVDIYIQWGGFGDNASHRYTYIEVQREMKNPDFLSKIELYKRQGWDYEIIVIDKLPGDHYDKDFEYIKAIIGNHIPEKRRGGRK